MGSNRGRASSHSGDWERDYEDDDGPMMPPTRTKQEGLESQPRRLKGKTAVQIAAALDEALDRAFPPQDIIVEGSLGEPEDHKDDPPPTDFMN